MNTNLCKHSHTRLEHPNCFINGSDKPDWYKNARIGFLDIETTSLNASFGTIIGWAIKERYGKTKAMVTDENHIRSPQEDKHLVKALIDEMLKYDMVVTYYGTKFDLPFARTRAHTHGLQFPAFGSVKHHDLYYTVKSKLRLDRNRLNNAGDVYGFHDKTYLNPKIWRRAGQGDKKSLAYILKHNVKDVELTEKIYNKMESLFKGTGKSI